MKKLTSLIVAIFAVALTSQAQTNAVTASTLEGGIQEIYQAAITATNWSLPVSYAHTITGSGRNLAAINLAYNFSDHVGFIIGDEELWSSHTSQYSTMAGGVTLNATIAPFAFIGIWTNIVATPYVADLIATPKENNPIADLLITGAKVDLFSFKNFEFSANGFYEVRTGQGAIGDGDWLGFGAVLTRKF